MGEMEKICKPKKERSLCIKDIEQFNMAILARWKWRFGMKKYRLWKG